MELIGKHYKTGEAVAVTIERGVIAQIDSLDTSDALPWLAPGLFDLQINGYGGVWFSDEQLSVEQVLTTLEAHFKHGITHLFPTLITNSFEALAHGFQTIRTACEQEPWANAMVLGCHLEGPYISAEDGPRGAHPVQHVRKCHYEEFAQLQQISGDRIRLLTLAPEAEGAEEFIRQVTQRHVTIAIGHTAANTEQISVAVAAGARLSTHLGNGAAGMMKRHPNCIWDQLGEPRLMASIIADGHHLPASVVRSFYYAKGPQGLILTCDASGLAGLPPGEYDYHGARFEVLESGSVVIAGQRQYLAGSGVQTDVCISKMIEMTGCDLATAWTMATDNPGRLLNVPSAQLAVGAPADIVLFEHGDTLSIKQCLQQGVVRYAC